MPEVLQSLITDEHRAVTGHAAAAIPFAFRPEDARRVRAVLEDDEPRWAERTGLAPYILALFLRAGREIIPSILPRGLLIQQEWRNFRPVRVGEVLQATRRVVDIRDRMGGRYGYGVLITTATDSRDAEREQAASNLSVVNQFDPAAARGSA